MANKKITIQHLYTTGTTAAPAPSALTLGEIAISARKNKEGIYFKNSDNEVVGVLTSGQTYELVEKATSGITTDGAFQMHREKLASEYNDDNKTDVNKYGHVLLHNGDLNEVNPELGVAAGMGHTHGQYQPKGDYLTGVTGDSGQPIVSLIENGVAKIGLTTGITNQINSGVSGYTKIVAHETKLGETGETGHVKLVGGDLSGKTGNIINGEAAASHHIHSQYFAKNDISSGLETWKKNEIAKEVLRVKAAVNGGITVDTSGVSINSGLKTKWNDAADAINAFLKDAKLTGNTVDTLKEIQQFLDGTGSTVQTLLDNLSDLTDTVSVNTNSISGLSLDVTTLKDESANYIKILDGDKHIKVGKLPGVSQTWVITHNSASTENATITATNDTTGLSFGSEFKIVDKIGYDANGHVVSGSTQILKLPVVPQASLEVSGIVTTTYGDLKDYTDIPTKTQLYYAAHRNHAHSQYVRLADLSGNTGDIITISCGTY